ncbi:MAG: TIR domain-containing protein [Cyanobacteria bacterium P01_F01_bin.143]
MKDFFVSYNRADKQWAEWIAWQLEEAGYSVVIQAWDFRPGGNFVLDMQRSAAESNKTIAVLSESYLKSSFTQPEWATALAQDPESLERKLIPVKVKDCKPDGLLRTIVYVNLIGLTETEAKQALLDSLPERAKPEKAPIFPESEVPSTTTLTERKIEKPQAFPSALSQVQQIKEKALQKRLDALNADYEAVSQKLEFAPNRAEKNRLERQIDIIVEEMDKVAIELDSLGRTTSKHEQNMRKIIVNGNYIENVEGDYIQQDKKSISSGKKLYVQQELDDLEEEREVIYEQYRGTIDDGQRLRLKRKLNNLDAEIDILKSQMNDK